jgi:hypothetical protein
MPLAWVHSQPVAAGQVVPLLFLLVWVPYRARSTERHQGSFLR